MQVLNVNFLSAHVILTHFAECMARGGGGHILGISSAFARIACSGRSSYSASKASLESLIRSIALEYAASGVLANSVAPGFIATDLTFQNNTLEQIEILETKIPLARLGTPSEVATFVTFLTSPSNTYITGQTFNIDGGFSIN
jgi:3-oxoacyl-[acyl-carrier protein] reductase